MSTVDSLLTEVKLAGGFPTDNYFTDAELVSIMDGEFKSRLIPLVMKLQGDFFSQDIDHTISATNSYRLPARNIGNKLRDVKLVQNTDVINLNRLYEEDKGSYLSGYYIKRNSISLSTNITSGTLRLTYYLSPSDLVLTTSCAVIASIDSTTQITVTALPSTMTTNVLVDFVQANSPNDLLSFDASITGVAGTSITFASLPTGLAVGDYVCIAKQSCIPQMPEILTSLLVQATLVSCLGSKKDSAKEYEAKGLEAMEKSMIDMLAPRVDSADTKMRGQGILTRIRLRR